MEEKNWGQIAAAIAFYFVSLFIGILYTEDGGEKWWLVSIGVIAYHLLMSVVVINETQLGALFRLGKVIHDLESGVNFAFWPFYYVRKATKNIIQVEIGVLEPEEKKKAEKLIPSESLFLLEDPLFVNWGSLKTAIPLERAEENEEEKRIFKGDPYADSMVTDTHVTVRFRIFSLTRLITKAGNPEAAIELIRGVVVSTLISNAGKSFVGRAIRNMEKMDDTLFLAVQEFVADPHSRAYDEDEGRSWGVDVEKTQITKIGTSKRVNVAIADKGKTIYNAQAERVRLAEVGAGEAEATQAKAIAERSRLEQEGAGKAEAERLLLIAREIGTKQLAEAAKTPEGLLILQLQALERALSEGKAVFLSADFSKILSALSEKLGTPPTK